MSREISGEDGAFREPPVIDLRFSKTHTVAALTFTFDVSTGDYCSRLRLEAWNGGEVLLDKIYQPDGPEWESGDAIKRFDRIRLTFLQTVPARRRARIQQLVFGIGVVFDEGTVMNASQRLEVDPLSRRLPTGNFDFTVVNVNQFGSGGQHLYDPDNPEGIWRYIERRNPIRMQYGQELTSGMTWGDLATETWATLEESTWGTIYEGGMVSWLEGGRYYLTATPTVSGLTASFSAQDALGLMDGTYEKGVYDGQPHTLYDLAQEVLEDAGLPQILQGVKPWKLWEGLKELTTTAPLTPAPHRECLQRIAHAACCVLYADREGYVRIEPAPVEDTGRALGLREVLGDPAAEKTATLRAVTCRAYSWYPEEKTGELAKADAVLEGRTAVHVSLSSAGVVDDVTVTGGTAVETAVYAQAVDLVLEGTGTAHISVTGRKLTQSAAVVSAPVEGADENAAVEEIDNTLITDAARALAVARWERDWLLYRTTYTLDTRGTPELDPLDVIRMDSQFEENFPARVLQVQTDYDGGMSGTMIAKRMVTE